MVRTALSVLAALAIAGAPAAARGLTGFFPTERPVAVRTAGLDLATPEGRRALEVRVFRAVRDHCLGDFPLPHRMFEIGHRICMEETRAALAPEIERLLGRAAPPARLAAAD